MTNSGIVGPATPQPRVTGVPVAGQSPVATSPTSAVWATPVANIAPGPTTNLNPQNYKYWRRALSKVRIGTAPANIFCIGDSTTCGNTTPPNYPSVLAGLMNRYFVPCEQTWVFSNSSVNLDPRVTLGTGWDTISFGQLYHLTAGGAGLLSYSPSLQQTKMNGPASVDTFDIYYIAINGGGTFTVNVNGGATLATVNSNNGVGATMVKQTVTCTAGSSNTVNIAGVSGDVYILAFNAYLSTAPSVRIANVGWGGTTAANWNSTSSPFTIGAFASNWQYDLAIVDLGINEANGGSVPPATFQANYQTLLSRIIAQPADVLLKSMVPSVAPAGTTEISYQPVLASLAATNNAAFLDIFSRWQSYAVGNPLGYYLDGLHPTQFGYADVAQAIFNVLKTL